MHVLEAHANAHQDLTEVLLQHGPDCKNACSERDHAGNNLLMQASADQFLAAKSDHLFAQFWIHRVLLSRHRWRDGDPVIPDTRPSCASARTSAS
jgi:hypothetical protein